MARLVSFLVTLGDVTLLPEDVWPDGDGPENPTAADVAEVMRECGSVHVIVREWGLLDEIEVMDNAGRRESVR